MKTAADNHAYGTTAEKAFLDQLAEGPKAVTLLANYVRAAEKRVAWGSIDKTEVVEYARVLYGNAMAKAATMQRMARSA